MSEEGAGNFKPVTEDDETIRWALEGANIPALMVSVMHLTGNTDHLHGDIRPATLPLEESEDNLSEEERDRVREMALEALKDYRDRGCTLPERPSEAMIVEAMNFVTGLPIPDDYMPLLREELVLFGEDPRNIPIGDEIPQSVKAGFKVLVIGAGMSGILAAIRLKQAGIPFVVADKNPKIGGTWYENTYPGCRVDSPNHLYSYLFEPSDDWPGYFSDRETLFGYFDRCVDKYGIRGDIRLNTSVERATYDEGANLWQVEVDGENGKETLTFSAVITAMGQLNTPKPPDIPGVESFEGISFHSARWEHEHDLKGKRVAVIGTGASATQFVPEIAPDVGEMFVFQRTPPWLLPTPDYHSDVTEQTRWLLKHFPFYARWFRFWIFRRDAADGALPFLYGDDAWNGPANTVGKDNDVLREAITEYILAQVEGHPDLASKLIPDYPPGGKRPLRDNGVWLDALKQDHVHLETTPITEITKDGLVLEDGRKVEVDALIYGTGFHADHFFWPIEFVGRGGVSLSEHWAGNPRAYKGISVPGFPNLFCLYGPNTNIVVGSSIIFFSECEVRYVMGCLKLLLEKGHAAMDCKKDVHDAYNEFIDAENAKRAWGAPNVKSWYKNAEGRVTQNWPGTHHEYWGITRAPDPADYEYI